MAKLYSDSRNLINHKQNNENLCTFANILKPQRQNVLKRPREVIHNLERNSNFTDSIFSTATIDARKLWRYIYTYIIHVYVHIY